MLDGIQYPMQCCMLLTATADLLHRAATTLQPQQQCTVAADTPCGLVQMKGVMSLNNERIVYNNLQPNAQSCCNTAAPSKL